MRNDEPKVSLFKTARLAELPPTAYSSLSGLSRMDAYGLQRSSQRAAEQNAGSPEFTIQALSIGN